MFQNQVILVTGATGSWGYELVRQLLDFDPKEIRLFSRNEFAQVNMKRFFSNNPKLKFIIGDVRDYLSILEACKNVDFVFHLAALKHVPVCEDQPTEAMKTNVKGTENVVRASILQGVKKVVDVSSDKAVEPINFYGMTKAIGEKLVIHGNSESENTRFVCIRGGNVLGTNGSVVPFFKKLILEGEDIPITSKLMTRYFLTISEAIHLLLTAALDSIGGETFVMKMKSCKIVDLANVMIEHMGKPNIELKEIGIRPGEKIHELLISEHESPHTHEFNSNYYVILPTNPSNLLQNQYHNLPKVNFKRYESSDALMSKSEIRDLLLKGGFLN
ncbi:polysaccharide biosynthesis protein [Peribacillus butanolivorans]|uniref:polysaccharide biosynthesis protein n=1 Tax=Peribacillus butanolivorans TaxID=421767 RepID=UPI00365C09F3